MIYPIIDIGSNTVKLAVFNPPSLEPIFFLSRQISLADCVRSVENTREMTENGFARLSSVLHEFRAYLASCNYPSPFIFCTEACRNLSNEKELLDCIKNVIGREADILSPAREALYTLQGVIASVPVESGVMVDLGGASTEICIFENSIISAPSVSIPVGCRTLYNQKMTETQISVLFESYSLDIPKKFPLCLSGGCAKALEKALKTDAFPTSARRDLPSMIRYLQTVLQNENSAEAAVCKNLFSDRFPLMYPSLLFFSAWIRRTLPSAVYLSHGGTREGYLMSLIQ